MFDPIRKVCNALLPDAEADLSRLRAGPAGGFLPSDAILSNALGPVRRKYGGLWVGGVATLTAETLRFEPNALNRAVHSGDNSFEVPLAAIAGTEREFGVITGIVRLDLRTGDTVKLRCMDARGFREQIEAARLSA